MGFDFWFSVFALVVSIIAFIFFVLGREPLEVA